jgi:hypothetical protein
VRALERGIRLSNRLRRTQPAERDDFALYVSKSVPQLKPASMQAIYGTAEPVPFVKCLFPIWLKPSSPESVWHG